MSFYFIISAQSCTVVNPEGSMPKITWKQLAGEDLIH